MSVVRQIVVAYLAALMSAGPIPLWAHEIIEHGSGGGCQTSVEARPSCRDCAFCKYRAVGSSEQASDHANSTIPIVSGVSGCQDCFVCYQFSQNSIAQSYFLGHTSCHLLEFLAVSYSRVVAFEYARFLGPRGPPIVI